MVMYTNLLSGSASKSYGSTSLIRTDNLFLPLMKFYIENDTQSFPSRLQNFSLNEAYGCTIYQLFRKNRAPIALWGPKWLQNIVLKFSWFSIEVRLLYRNLWVLHRSTGFL